jgi:Leucine-rich repeat (LRR) protein
MSRIATQPFLETKCKCTEFLDLSGNQLIGTIPGAMFNSMTNLGRCVLSFNLLTGTVPIEAGASDSIEDLDLQHNILTGSIPTQLGTGVMIDYVRLQNNQLTGTIADWSQFSEISEY